MVENNSFDELTFSEFKRKFIDELKNQKRKITEHILWKCVSAQFCQEINCFWKTRWRNNEEFILIISNLERGVFFFFFFSYLEVSGYRFSRFCFSSFFCFFLKLFFSKSTKQKQITFQFSESVIIIHSQLDISEFIFLIRGSL